MLSYEIHETLVESLNNFPAEEKTKWYVNFIIFRRFRSFDKRDY